MNVLSKILKQKGITHRELAEKSGITAATISHIINGITSPKVETLEKIADAIDVPIESFFSEHSGIIHLIIKNELHTFYSLDDAFKYLLSLIKEKDDN